MLQTEFNIDAIASRLTRAEGALTDMTPLMQDIGEFMIESTKENFRDSTSPDGIKWAAKSQATLDAYAARGDRVSTKPLIGPTGVLSSTIFSEASATSVAWGSSQIQAAVMQLGAGKGAFGTASNGSKIPWGNIPARPYLGIGSEDEAGIIAIAEEYIAGAFGED